MKKIRINYLITIALLLIAITMTFVPVIKYGQSVPNGDGTFTSVTHYYSLVWFVFQLNIIDGLSARNAFMLITIILFYMSSILVIIFIFINKNYLVNIFLIVSALFLIPSIGYWYTLPFCIAGSAAYILMSFVNIFIDYRNKDMKKNSAKGIGKNIKRYRINSHLTQEDLAKKIYVSRSLIAKFESGSATPNEYQIENIAKELNISVDDLLIKVSD